MAKDAQQLEKIVLTRVLRLNEHIYGIVLGLIAGIGMFVITNWLVLKGGPMTPEGEVLIGPHLALLGQFFIGYDVSFVGSLIGLVYGAVVGYVVGFLIAKSYNWIVNSREKPSRAL
jgi:hypothetical protein